MFLLAPVLVVTQPAANAPVMSLSAASALATKRRVPGTAFVLLAPGDTYTTGGMPSQNMTSNYEVFNSGTDGDTVLAAPAPGSGAIPPPSVVTYPDGHAVLVLRGTTVTLNLSAAPYGATIADSGGTVSAASPVWNNPNANLKVVIKTHNVSTAANGCLMSVNYVPTTGTTPGTSVFQYEGNSTLTMIGVSCNPETLTAIAQSNVIPNGSQRFPPSTSCPMQQNSYRDLEGRYDRLQRKSRNLRSEVARLQRELHSLRVAHKRKSAAKHGA